jgi:hypothetical protein
MLFFTALALCTHASRADDSKKKGHAVTVSASGLTTIMTTSRGDTSGTISEKNGGNAIAGRIGYRSPWVAGVFADVGYFPIYRRDRQVDLGNAGGLATTRASLSSTSLAFGLSADLWRFRASAALAWNQVDVTSMTLGQTSHASETDLGYMVALAAYPVRYHRIETGVEARALFITEAQVTVFCFGLTLGGDALSW